MKPSIRVVLGVVAAASLTLAGCGGGEDVTETNTFPTENVTITLAGWSLSTTPEFKTLAEGFKALHPNVTVQIKEYDAAQYDTLMTADLSAGTAPDIITQKTFKNYYAYATGGALLDISDVAKKLPSTMSAKSAYTVEGKTYGVPYRQDSWVLYYDKDLFDKAGVKYPDGAWTWDDYAKTAKDLTAGLKASGSSAVGTYQHLWQSTVQGFALAQSKGADLTKPDYSWLKPYYTRVLDLQTAGAQPTFGTASTAKLTYQAQFGKQSAAMLPMGTWYVATLLAQQKSGDANKFNWGIAPAPQLDKSTAGTSNTPVTFGDPTGMSINGAIKDGAKVTVAKAFLEYASGPDGAKALAGIGITPADTSAAVAQAYFSLAGVPTDELSKFAWTKHETKLENPVGKYTVGVQNLLNILHSAVLSNSKTIDDAITEAQNQAKSTVLNQ
ncbi:MAG TPA: extracellular solute-binding protein [Candidatus Limnocylindrales bacterium]|nr:extracellular solute-binding protein [Candidatus Limnocylindrales bacterium]